MSRVAILGAGAVGTRVARYLLASGSAGSVDRVLLRDVDPERLSGALAVLDEAAADGRVEVEHAPFPDQADADVIVVATPRGTQLRAVREALSGGIPVVLSGDGLAETVAVARLADEAGERGVPVVLGAGFAPGLSGVLAAHARSWFDHVEEIHVAKVGAGGPACALVHHRALSRLSYDWRGGGWRRRPGGSGRELCWFPEPVGPMDCYRAALSDPVLLHHAFPEVERITARMAATRLDRLTAPLPMLSPTRVEGGVERFASRSAAGGAPPRMSASWGWRNVPLWRPPRWLPRRSNGRWPVASGSGGWRASPRWWNRCPSSRTWVTGAWWRRSSKARHAVV